MEPNAIPRELNTWAAAFIQTYDRDKGWHGNLNAPRNLSFSLWNKCFIQEPMLSLSYFEQSWFMSVFLTGLNGRDLKKCDVMYFCAPTVTFFVLVHPKHSQIQSSLCTLAACFAVRDKVPSIIISVNSSYNWFCVLVLVPCSPGIDDKVTPFIYITILLAEVKKP